MTADTNVPDITILDLHDEPTVRDVDLAMQLGMPGVANMRQIIEENTEEIQSYGILHAAHASSTMSGGSTGDITEYHLTEPQALCLCQISRAPRAIDARRMIIMAFMAWRQSQGCMAPQPADMEGVIAGPCSFPYLCQGNTRFDWQGHSISTDLSRLDPSRDVVGLLPDGVIDIVRLTGRPYGLGGRQGITRRYLNPDIEEATPVMVIILGQIGSKIGRWVH